MADNHGIVIGTSANVTVGAMASGTGASAVNVTLGADLAEFRRLLQEFTAAVHQSGNTDASLVDATKQLTEELERPQPRGSRIRELLARAAPYLGTAAGLLEIMSQMQHLAAALV